MHPPTRRTPSRLGGIARLAPRKALVATAFLVVLGVVGTSPALAARHRQSFPATRVTAGIATFRLVDLDPRTVVGGTLEWRRRSRALSPARLRAAARRRLLRVRLSRARSRLATAASASRPTLVVTTTASQPTVTITSAPSDPTTATDARLTFTVSGAKSVRCALDGASPARCSSPVSYGGLAPGGHKFTVSATSSTGSATAEADWTITAPPTASTPTTQSPAAPSYAIRGMYGRDFSASGFDTLRSLGFDVIDSNPYADSLDPLVSAGIKGFVWLGGYSNSTCSFNYSDDWVRSHVANVAGNPGVAAYFIDDEPDAVACPDAPAQIKARSDLVKSLDPGPPTFIVVYKVDQFKLWAGKVDVLGLDRYPCSIKNGCDYTKIDAEAAEADRLGVRYWGVIQAHGDDWYKVPTPDELHQEFVHWRATRMEGYLVFAWAWPSWDSSLWLANHPELQQQLAVENAS